MTTTPTTTIDPSRFCRVCAFALVAFVVGTIVLLVLVLNPPAPPPDYSTIPIVADTSWDAVTGGGWNYSKRTATNDATIAQQTPTPVSPQNVLSIDFTGTKQDTEPTVHFHALPGAREVYAEWWIKFSKNWTCSPAGCGKVSFFFPSSGGDAYVGVYCDTESGGQCATSTPEYFVVGGQLQWTGDGRAPYSGYPLIANVTRSKLYRDRWYRVAHYLKWSSTPTTRDGIWRIYVDGVLNLERTDILTEIGPAIEFQFAMSRQQPPPPGEFAYIDHAIVRAQ